MPGHHYSFRIHTEKDLFRKLEQEFKDFEADQTSSRHAINFAMTAWHLREWAWGLRLKNDDREQQRLFGRIFKDCKDFDKHLLALCDELGIMQEVTNGSKHLDSKIKEAVADTFVASTINLDVSRGYPTETPLHAQVTLTDGRTVPFIQVARTVLEFWRSKFSI